MTVKSIHTTPRRPAARRAARASVTSLAKDRRTQRIFQALASEARLCIVRELSAVEEKCVCDLVGCCGLGWATVSHHLSILREAGIVRDEKRGQQVFYRLALPCVTHFILCIEQTSCPESFNSIVCCR
ncbi:MAG: ArsR/SmtB family transcription factor [Candidatus Methylacidiphilales bacterium]